MRRAMVLTALLLLAGLLAFGVYMLVRIGPANVWGMLRYDQREEGTLVVGDRAPDVALVTLDGTGRVNLHQRLAGKPLVLIFGSFT
jgi:hypothetical protein